MKNLKSLLHILQLEEYNLSNLKQWLKKHPNYQTTTSKKKLIWTIKAKTIFTLSLPIYLLSFGTLHFPAIYITTTIFNLLESPIKFLLPLLAKLKLKLHPNLIVIGITGSYAKTSVKEFTNKLLSQKYNVLTPPKNYNTLLGLSFSILKDLKPSHQIFIAELAAYHPGDIKKLTQLVKPNIGIITAIGRQHLVRFGSTKNILKAKWELAQALPSNGTLIVNADDPKLQSKLPNYTREKICYRYYNPLNKSFPACNYLLEFRVTAATELGTIFEHSITQNHSIKLQTKLLGTHNVSNIMAAIAVARKLQVSDRQISKAISSLKPPKHRLETIKGSHGTLIIDNSYSSNPDSAKASLNVLSNFKDRPKIVVTPGFIELGKQQYKENKLFGQQLTQVADEIIVVGKTNRQAIKAGLKGKGIFVDTIEQAQEKLKLITQPLSVILFENDLPDQYD